MPVYYGTSKELPGGYSRFGTRMESVKKGQVRRWGIRKVTHDQIDAIKEGRPVPPTPGAPPRVEERRSGRAVVRDVQRGTVSHTRKEPEPPKIEYKKAELTDTQMAKVQRFKDVRRIIGPKQQNQKPVLTITRFDPETKTQEELFNRIKKASSRLSDIQIAKLMNPYSKKTLDDMHKYTVSRMRDVLRKAGPPVRPKGEPIKETSIYTNFSTKSTPADKPAEPGKPT
jgi:hypothetical protein